MARDMFSIHLPTLDRPEGGKAWKLLRATMTEVLSKLSARPFFPLPSGPLMPALPLCTTASIIRREWVAFSHIMPCVLVLVASIGALVLVAAVLSKFGSGSKGAISGLRNHVCFALERGNPEHQVECLRRVILDRSCGLRLPLDVCFSPKATKLAQWRIMSRRAKI